MRWRWLLLDYVDPQLGLSPRQRREVRRRARWARIPQTPGRPTTRLARLTGGQITRGADLLVVLIPPIIMAVIVAPMFLFGPVSRGVYVMTLVPVQVAVTWILVILLGRISWRPRVNIALRQLGHDVCWRCGYWLRGLGSDVGRCPECGAVREPMPQSEAP